MVQQRVRKAHRPVDDQTRALIQNAARDGKRSRNSIAREFKVAGETVTRICAEDGISFDRTQTEAAVRAHSIDLAEERVLLVKEMVAEVREQLDLVNAPFMVWSFGGMDGEIHSHLLDSAPMAERNTVLRSAGIAFDKASRIVESDPETSGAKSVLSAIETGLRAVVAELDAGLTPEDAE